MSNGEVLERAMQEANVQKYPLTHKWDFRTGSPHKVFRAIQDVGDELGYAIQITKPLTLIGSPIGDTATFEAEIKAEMPMTSRYSWQQGLLGIVFVCIGVAPFLFLWGYDEIPLNLLLRLALFSGGFCLIIAGIVLVAGGSKKRKRMLLVKMEGEAYKASARIFPTTINAVEPPPGEPYKDSAKQVEWAQEIDIIADIRVVISGSIATAAGETQIKQENVTDTDRRILQDDFGKFMKRIEATLPSYMVRQPQ